MTRKAKGNGAAPKMGRPPLGEVALTQRMELRLTQAQRRKLDALGGSAWIRERIDKAKG